MPMEDTYGIQSRIGSIIVVERWYCCRGSPVFSDRNIQKAHLPAVRMARKKQRKRAKPRQLQDKIRIVR